MNIFTYLHRITTSVIKTAINMGPVNFSFESLTSLSEYVRIMATA